METSQTQHNQIIKPQNIFIAEKKELYRSYMPFIKSGGLFLPFNDDVQPNMVHLGQNIMILLSVLDKPKTPIKSPIVWINKFGIHKGYGVALGDSPQSKSLKEFIEVNIVDLLSKKEPTYTI